MKESPLVKPWHFNAFMVLLILFAGDIFAQEQDSTVLVRIETKDGNEYVGKIVERQSDLIRLQTEKLGLISIRLIDIAKIDTVKVTQIRGNQYWFENPQATRYLWGPNGYGLKRGEGYYQNIWVLFNQFSIGVTDQFSIGGGVIPLFLFGSPFSPAWVTPKFSIPLEENKVNLGVGGLFGKVVGLPDTGFGIAYGLVTLGSRDQNMTFGLGYGYADGRWADRPAISVSGMIRTGPRGYFLTENYYLHTAGSGGVLLTFGGRRIIKQTGLDFGLIIPTNGDGMLVAIPWLGLTVPFGRKIRP